MFALRRSVRAAASVAARSWKPVTSTTVAAATSTSLSSAPLSTLVETSSQHKTSWGFTAIVAGAAAIVGSACAVYAAGESGGDKKTAATVPTKKELGRPFVVALTGGPCGGKSTAMATLSARLTNLGYSVYVVPEVATMVISGGASFANVSSEQLLSMEAAILDLQVNLEDGFEKIAAADEKPAVVLCDRGVMDIGAYLPPWMWHLLLDESKRDAASMRDMRYDAVIHLVTAADGAEKFYTTANNTARRETPEQARELDRKVRDSWVGHRRLGIVDNSTDFKNKMRRACDFICKSLGVPGPAASERHFVLPVGALDDTTKDWPKDVPFEDFDVEVSFLNASDKSQVRIQRRRQGSSSSYYASSQVGATSTVLERHISGREYAALKAQVDPDAPVVKRKERCFSWNNRYYNMRELIVEGGATVVLLKVDDDTKTPLTDVIPPFLIQGATRHWFLYGDRAVTEVTDDASYTTEGFARRLAKAARDAKELRGRPFHAARDSDETSKPRDF